MRTPFASVAARADEVTAPRAGDDVVPHAEVVMDRAFTLRATPAMVWPWLVQLGKWRAGWYLPRTIERFLPPGRRALRRVDPAWQALAVGDVIPDYGGRDEIFEVVLVDPPRALVHRSRRGRTDLSWALTLREETPGTTRLHLRLRLGSVRHRRLAETAGGLLDALTVAGLAAGLRERVRHSDESA